MIPADRFADALVRAGGDPARADDVVADLAERHAEPHRRYHTAEHVAEVVAELDRLAGTPPDAVLLAAAFHDAVYDVRAGSGGSEEASAELAAAQLAAAGVGAASVEEVGRLILLTAGHEVDAGDEAGALLVDADLWILSSPPDRYDRYAADVRAEYAHVPDDLWRTGRGAVLQHFLGAAPALYASGPEGDRTARRVRAIANLTRELGALDA